jgi:hypothetical protein
MDVKDKVYRTNPHKKEELKENIFYCFCGTILDPYQENLVILGSESCSSCRQLGSGSCAIMYIWTHRVLYIIPLDL